MVGKNLLRRLASSIGVALVLASFLGVASRARAFCRTHTLDPASSGCPAQCLQQGVPLYWEDSQVSYAFNERGFSGIPDAQLRATFRAAFGVWQAVTCDGQSVGFELTEELATTTLDEGPKASEPNTNAVVEYDSATWAARDHSPHAFAVTSVWFSKNGRIYGADMLFNGGMGTFGDCAVMTCSSAAPPRVDLQNVATHEIGHFLGLGHSQFDDATMACEASSGEMLKRTLEADDIAGLCNAYPPGLSFQKADDPNACSLGSSPSAALWLLGLLLLRRRQRVTPSTLKP